MVRMDHFRGTLFEGDRVLLDSVEGYLAFHENKEGRRRWFGLIDLPSDQQALVLPGVRYRLALDDGRDGFIYADIPDGNKPGQDIIAEFQVTGEIRVKPSRARL